MNGIPLPFLEAAAGSLLVTVAVLSAGRSPRLLKAAAQWHIGSFHPLSPNWITVWGLAFTWSGFALFLLGYPGIGVPIGTFGGLLDHLDGKVARACGHEARTPASWADMNVAGVTELGKVLDPAKDKMSILPILAWFAHEGLMPVSVVAVLIVPELVGTLGRWPFNLRRPRWLFWEKPGSSAATIWGKTKTACEWATVIAAVLLRQGWAASVGISIDPIQEVGGLAASSVFLAFMSVASRRIDLSVSSRTKD